MFYRCKLWKFVLLQQICLHIALAALSSGSPSSSNTTDNLLIARCRSNCSYDKVCQNHCLRNYLENSAYKKYGDCPSNPSSQLDVLCLNTCAGTDYKCPGVEKCCGHSCGMSCQVPVGLDKVKGLPPIPFNVLLQDKGKAYRMARVQWDMKLENDRSKTFYIVESRFQISTNFAERRMENDWQLHAPGSFMQTDHGNLKRYIGELKLKPGRWYQVRVAAVNDMGTRGYSAHSKAFQLSKKPNPPQPPSTLNVGTLNKSDNRTYSCRVSWSLPRSDLPIDKYKLSWSLYLNDTGGSHVKANSSLFKETVSISAPARYYEIRGLLPNSYYYVQIQAISLYGKKRLKSPSNSKLMNTSVSREAVPPPATVTSLDNLLMGDAGYRRPKGGTALKDGTPGAITGTIKYQFHLKPSGLAVRLSWSERGYGRYRVHICRGGRDCLPRGMGHSNWHDVILKRNSYEFTKLDFDTRYTVGVRIGHKRGPTYDIVRSFTTPKCDHFRTSGGTPLPPAQCLPRATT